MNKQSKTDLYIYIVIFILLIIMLFGVAQQEKDMQEIKQRYNMVQEEKMYLLEELDKLESSAKEDVNRDGVVDSKDLLLVRKKLLGE